MARAAATAAAMIVCLTGCTLPNADERGSRVEAWAEAQGWAPMTLNGSHFDLRAFAPSHLRTARRLHVYIEGDGQAWLDRQTPSFAPTPLNPLALRLAMADGFASVVYLARPCQYVRDAAFRHCNPKYWTSHRFATELVDAMDQALDRLATVYGPTELVLIGYSGGGAMAALLAERRKDVVGLVTVAGVLDTKTWAAEARTSDLTGSLNPLAIAAQLRRLQQWHFVGERDTVVPAGVLGSFMTVQGSSSSSQKLDLPGFDHGCCWVKAWPQLSSVFATSMP